MKKDLNDIRPAKGAVKIKNKNPKLNKQVPPTPKVIQDVGHANAVEQEDIPSQDAINIMNQLNVHKENLVRAMKGFNSILNESTLKKNKSVQQLQHEQSLVNELAQSAASVNNISPGEGSIGLCVFALRQTLSLRDAGNQLAYKVQNIAEKINELIPKDNKEMEEKKTKLKELAEELGLDITIDKA